MSKVLVIGGGPAGCFAAIAAAEQGHQVILLERNEKIGKKLFITGKEDVTLPMHVIRKNYSQTFQGIPSSYTAQSILMTISGSWISLNRMEHR